MKSRNAAHFRNKDSCFRHPSSCSLGSSHDTPINGAERTRHVLLEPRFHVDAVAESHERRTGPSFINHFNHTAQRCMPSH
jgi:hypothetical protein